MTFKVDDGFHSHNKIRKVIAECPAALGLWTVAGSWSSANLTDGFVPESELPWLFTGWEPLAQMLVTARLWRRVKGGYSFHEWHRDQRSNTIRNPSSDSVRLEREASRLRAAEWRRKRREDRTAYVQPHVQRDETVRTQLSSSTSSTTKRRQRGAAAPPLAAADQPAVSLTPHPFIDDGSGKSCAKCGTLKTNRIHTVRRTQAKGSGGVA